MQNRLVTLAACLGLLAPLSLRADDPAPPQITGLSVSNTLKTVTWAPYPAAQHYDLLSTLDLGQLFTTDLSGAVSGYTWTGTNSNASSLYQLRVTTMSSNALLTANVLNRLAYGPTPDELERILTGPSPLGPQGYIVEQLDFTTINETIDTDDNAYSSNTNWTYVTATGTAGADRFYIYLSVYC